MILAAAHTHTHTPLLIILNRLLQPIFKLRPVFMAPLPLTPDSTRRHNGSCILLARAPPPRRHLVYPQPTFSTPTSILFHQSPGCGSLAPSIFTSRFQPESMK